MEQKIPNIIQADIKRIISRDFPSSEITTIESILSSYQSETEIGRIRVYASILKMSEGSVHLLKEYVSKANKDYRDILSIAEYPNYSEHAFEDELSEEKEKELIESDWIQYQTWLNRI